MSIAHTTLERKRPIGATCARDALAAGPIELPPPVIDGLLRQRETANIIAAPKMGKSWLGLSLALAVASGRQWLGMRCRQGRVLLVDNELMPKTIYTRLQTTQTALGVPDEALGDIDVMPCRGALLDVHAIGERLEGVPPGTYSLVILDALYRALPAGTNENSNSDIAALFNTIDQLAGRLDAAWACVHHASKGNQAQKNVTDTGSGAGAMARAVDAHVILRPHEAKDCAVLECAGRSFAPVAPLALRWAFPLWQVADGIDPRKLKGLDRRGEAQRSKDADDKRSILDALADGPLGLNPICQKIGAGHPRGTRLLRELEESGDVSVRTTIGRGGRTRTYARNLDAKP